MLPFRGRHIVVVEQSEHYLRLVGQPNWFDRTLAEVRRHSDGTVASLECATFVYTRVPYDPQVTIPGGHPA